MSGRKLLVFSKAQTSHRGISPLCWWRGPGGHGFHHRWQPLLLDDVWMNVAVSQSWIKMPSLASACKHTLIWVHPHTRPHTPIILHRLPSTVLYVGQEGTGTKVLSGSEPFNYRPVFGDFSIKPRTIEAFSNGQPAELTHMSSSYDRTHTQTHTHSMVGQGDQDFTEIRDDPGNRLVTGIRQFSGLGPFSTSDSSTAMHYRTVETILFYC